MSAASIWEIEIKRVLKKLHAPPDVGALVADSGFERLAIEFEHATEAARLPAIHSDPFDRMLIAQARVEGLALLSADAALRRYDVTLVQVTPD